jgi:3D (Asp-Asp-Asp) domain-containing protein
MRRYNLTVHILFWILIALLLSSAALIVFSRIGLFEPDLSFLLQDELPENEEKVVVEKVKEVEKEVEWFYFVASGYSANDSEQGTDSTTATGSEVRQGIIAVDPDIIPLGSKVEIKNMGVFTAEDTGGKIKGNKLDIFFDSKKDAKDFGKKGVWVRILDSSGEIEVGGLYGSVPLNNDESSEENL